MNVGASEGPVPWLLRKSLAKPADIGAMPAHGSAQLANDLWAAYLARKGMRAWAYGPGSVETDIRRDVPAWIAALLRPFFAPWTRQPSESAGDILRLILDPTLPAAGGSACRRGPFPADPFILDARRQDDCVELAQQLLAGALAARL